MMDYFARNQANAAGPAIGSGADEVHKSDKLQVRSKPGKSRSE
jgi:hypothetical protein